MSEIQKPPRSFSGTLLNIELLNLVQLICLAKTNHAISVESVFGKGAIHARSGHLYHAQCGGQQGEEAFFEILRWKRGQFVAVLHEALETPPSLTSRWEYLLVQAAQNRSEALEMQERAGKPDSEPRGFAGIIKDIELSDMVQLICQSGGDHTVKVVSVEGSGILWARSGQICHARADGIEGEEAFSRIIHWPGGSFTSLASQEMAKHTISIPWDSLLMNAMRRHDEISAPAGTRHESETTEEGNTGADAYTHCSDTGPSDLGAPVGYVQPGPDTMVGFSGSMVHIELTYVLQLFCLGKSIHRIVVQSPEGTGTIFVGSGSILCAEMGDQEGEPAFYQMHRWTEGEFEAKPARDLQIKETIHKPWEFLLIEAARYRSQAGDDAKESAKLGSCRCDFRGVIHEISLSDLMHVVCFSRSNQMISLVSAVNSAMIYVRSGQVLHAQTGELQGPEAFFEAFRWTTGRFSAELLPEEVAIPTTIDQPWEYLVMEAVRLMDEQSGTGDGDEEASGTEHPSEAEAFGQRLRKLRTLNELESFRKKLIKMQLVEKIRFALTGDKEARSSLIRESNRLIQVAVIRNPRISDPEVLAIANSKGIDEEVLRQVASNRNWIRSYALRLALVNNPRTPLPKALQFLGTLMPKDLTLIAKSKNVPEAVAQAARRRMIQK
jgi:hypothetical protein